MSDQSLADFVVGHAEPEPAAPEPAAPESAERGPAATAKRPYKRRKTLTRPTARPRGEPSARKSREAETRQTEQRVQDYHFDFGPRRNLPYIPPRPGFVQRWVRVEVGNEPDAPNLQRRYGHYWTPRQPQTLSDTDTNAFVSSQIGNGEIRVRGNVLMERPLQAAEAHRAHVKEQTDGQRGKVTQDLMDASYVMHGMQPRVEPETRSTVERGSMRVADDD